MTPSPFSARSRSSSAGLDIPATQHQHTFPSRRTQTEGVHTCFMSDVFPCLRNLPTSVGCHASSALPPLSTVLECERQPKPTTSSVSSASATRPQDMPDNQLLLQFDHTSEIANSPRLHYNTEARMHSTHFPAGHKLNSRFVAKYQLEDELGSGGYGFVITAYHRIYGHEVAVKFIIKDKVPEHAWTEDEVHGRLPTEVLVLSYINHENIVKCLDLFEDNLYFYMVQELHGSPWNSHHKLGSLQPPGQSRSSNSSMTTPALSPSSSESSLPNSEPGTPPHVYATIQSHIAHEHSIQRAMSEQDVPKLYRSQTSLSPYQQSGITRRQSYDLFECIEQSEDKRLTEAQARYVFAQVVDAVHYLDSLGIAHRDIKDENLVIDQNLKIKLIDFGSSTVVNPLEPRPYYSLFFGTAAYASSEILLKKSYQAAPAEVWTLGVLLSYLLAGVSPFPTARDAVDGRIFISEKVCKISDLAMDLMKSCLDRNPETRATISEIKAHPWLNLVQAAL